MSAPAPLFMFQNAAGVLPNEGIPLTRRVMVPPEPTQQNALTPEDPGNWSAEEQQIALAQITMLLRQLLQASTANTQAGAPQQAAPTDPLAFWRNDVGYFLSEKHTNFRFLANGLRPCDHPGLWTQSFEYQTLKLPVNMTVEEMVRRVGIPSRKLQEMVELVVTQQGTQFGQGQVLSRNGPLAGSTLEQIGWNETRTEDNPVWVVLGPLEP